MLNDLLQRIWENLDLLKLSLVLGIGYAGGRIFVDTLQYFLKNIHGYILRKRLDRMANKLLEAQKELNAALAKEQPYQRFDDAWTEKDTHFE